MASKKKHRANQETILEENSDSDFEPTNTVKSSKTPKQKKRKQKDKEETVNSKPKKEPVKKSKRPKNIVDTAVVFEETGDPNSMKGLIKIGGHVSVQDGLHLSLSRSHQIGGKCMAIFVRNQRTWISKPMEQSTITQFKDACQKYKIPPHLVLVHGSYLVNLANPDLEKLKKSQEAFIDEVSRCEQLGLTLYNFHPGSHLGSDEDESLKRISDSINLSHTKTKDVIVVLENTAGQGTNLGHSFEQLRKIIGGIQDKTRIGVCIDTCHAFAAGYDLRTKEKCDQVFKEFEEKVGFKYLKGMHLNDSKQKLGSRADRHANIGKGEIGLECFKYIVNDKRFINIPLVLETEGPYEEEIKLLYSLIEE